MAALPDVPGVLRIDTRYGGGADVTASSRTFWSYSGTAPSNATCAAFAAFWDTTFETGFLGLMSDSSVFFGSTVTDLTTPTSGRGETSVAFAGTRGTTLIPFGAAAVIDMKIARRYRGGKPRIYLPLGIDTDLTGGFQWSPTFQGEVNGAWSGQLGTIAGHSISGTTIVTQVAVSYYSGFTNVPYGTPTKYRRVPVLRVGGPLVDLVTEGVCAAHVGSQRRRNQAA